MTKRIEFIINSLSDIQGTIRAIDAKFFAIFAILLLPLAELDEISKSFKGLASIKPTIMMIILVILLISWFLGIAICLLGIYSINNPKKRLKGYRKYNGNNLFYRPSLFNVTFINQFFPFAIESTKSLENLIKELEINEEEIFKELAFEQVKLAYVRDLKMIRQRLSLIFLLITVLAIATLLIMNSALTNG